MRSFSRKAFLAVSLVLVLTLVVGYKAAEALGSSSQPAPPPQVHVEKQERTRVAPSAISALARQGVFIVTPESTVSSGGTGFLLDVPKHGLLLITNRHVCESLDAEATAHRLHQGNEMYVAYQLNKSTTTDLCIIKPPQELINTRIGFEMAQVDVVPGERVTVFGHPYLRPLTESGGHFVNTIREPLNMTGTAFDRKHVMLIGRLDFMVFPGNSGSPLLNSAGQVVGVIFAMEGRTRNGLFVPLSELKKFIETQE